MYAVLDTFIVNRGSERNQVGLDLHKVAAFLYLATGKNENESIAKLKPMLTRHNEEWKVKV